eukprot:11467996-Alexandrium_andersonii.AAC.1
MCIRDSVPLAVALPGVPVARVVLVPLEVPDLPPGSLGLVLAAGEGPIQRAERPPLDDLVEGLLAGLVGLVRGGEPEGHVERVLLVRLLGPLVRPDGASLRVSPDRAGRTPLPR